MHTHESANPSFVPPVTKSESTTRAFQVPSPETAETAEPDIQARLDHANRFGHDLPRSQPSVQRQVEPDGEREDEDEPVVQTKLTIGQPGDKYEQEADAMAAKVMAMPDADLVKGEGVTSKGEGVQRQVVPEEETLQARHQIQAKGNAPAVPGGFEGKLAQHKGGGRPLSDETRAFMEPRFGTDFSNVRIHETPDLANAIQAQAFTHGQDIYFNAGKYDPASKGGKELLAHELTHVVQQTQGNIHRKSNQNQHGGTSFWDWYNGSGKNEGKEYQKLRGELEPEGYKFHTRVAVGTKANGKPLFQSGYPNNDTLSDEVAWSVHHPSGKWSWMTTKNVVKKCQGLSKGTFSHWLRGEGKSFLSLKNELMQKGYHFTLFTYSDSDGWEEEAHRDTIPWNILSNRVVWRISKREVLVGRETTESIISKCQDLLNNEVSSEREHNDAVPENLIFDPDHPHMPMLYELFPLMGEGISSKSGFRLTILLQKAWNHLPNHRKSAVQNINEAYTFATHLQSFFDNPDTSQSTQRHITELVKGLKNIGDLIIIKPEKDRLESFKDALKERFEYVAKRILHMESQFIAIDEGRIQGWVSSQLSPFANGFLTGLREFGDDEFQALLQRYTESAVFNVIFPSVLAAGTVHGITEDAVEMFQQAWKTATDPTEAASQIIDSMEAFSDLMHELSSIEGGALAKELGREAAKSLVKQLRDFNATKTVVEFSYKLGRVVGPTVVYTVLSLLGFEIVAAGRLIVWGRSALTRLRELKAFKQLNRLLPDPPGYKPGLDLPEPDLDLPKPDLDNRPKPTKHKSDRDVELSQVSRPTGYTEKQVLSDLDELFENNKALFARLRNLLAQGLPTEQVNSGHLNILKGNIAEILARPLQLEELAKIVRRHPNARLISGVKANILGRNKPVLFGDNIIATVQGDNLHVHMLFEVKSGPKGGQEATSQVHKWIEDHLDEGFEVILSDGSKYQYAPGTQQTGQVIGLAYAPRTIIAPRGAERLGINSADQIASQTNRHALDLTAEQITYLAKRVLTTPP